MNDSRGHLARFDFSAQIQDAADLSRPHVSASVVKQLFRAADNETMRPNAKFYLLVCKARDIRPNGNAVIRFDDL